jgi:GAF domain-containing protein
MDRRQQWAAVLAAAANPPADREAALVAAMELGVDVAPAVVASSVTVRTDGGFRTAASGNALALALDRAQYDAGAGPCLDAARTGASLRIDLVTEQPAYPTFSAAAAGHGVLSSLSVPLLHLDRPAALNFYSAAGAAFADEHSQRTAGLLGRCVAALLPGGKVEPEVPVAMRVRRQLVDRALRELMAARRLDRAAAFDVLVRRCLAEQRSMFELAADLLDRAGPREGR